MTIAAPTPANPTGFFVPVDPPPAGFNGINSGQTVPLEFYAETPAGAPITNLSAVDVSIAPVACTTSTVEAGMPARADRSG